MLEIRAARADEELTLCLALNNAVWTHDPVGLAEIRSMVASLPEQEHFLAWEGGEAVGMAFVARSPSRPEPGGRICVPASNRRQGIGTALYAEISRWAAEREADVLLGWVPTQDPDGLAWAELRGFVEIGRDELLELELAGLEPPPLAPPPGIEIVTWAQRPELARGLYEVALEAWPDIPGQDTDEVEPFDDWLRHHMQGAGDEPDAVFVALADGEVVGYSKFSLSSEQPRAAHHDVTGVKRAWRGRGIAGALKRAQVAWAIERGYERLLTMNEVRNAPIQKLNRRFGYRPRPGRIRVRGPLASP
jgi:GNAT superfamily N-acetyltransferase